MKITALEVKNVQWANEQQTMINMDVRFSHMPNKFVPFAATSYDTEEHGKNLFERAVNQEFGEIAAWTPPPQEQVEADVRAQRNGLLEEMDMIISNPLRWASMTTEQQSNWATYRQALLDIPQQQGFPYNVTWPNKPE